MNSSCVNIKDNREVPDVLSYKEYYPFGMLVPNRYASSSAYRYGFQGQEKDDEIKGEGNSLNYKYRMHDPRVGRFFAVDPLTKSYPHYTPYSFSGNKVIHAVELEGLEEKIVHTQYLGNYRYTTVLKRSQFQYKEWSNMKKTWWKTIFMGEGARNESNFGGLGYKDYYHALYDYNKPAYDAEKNVWNGQNNGTLFITDYHGTSYFGYNKTPLKSEGTKNSVGTLDTILDLAGYVEMGASGSVVVSGGTSSVVAIPILKVAEVVGAIAGIEKFVIEYTNGDKKDALQTLTDEFISPLVVSRVFKMAKKKTKTEKGKQKLDFMEKLVNEAISKGLDYIEFPMENNNPTTTEEKL